MLNSSCDSWYPLPVGVDLGRNDEYEKFDNALDSTTQAILAYGMVKEWLSPYLYNQDLMETHLSTKEYTAYSDAMRINAMRLLMGEANKEMKNLATKLSVGKILGRLK